MRNRNSKKTFKTLTITAAVAIFGIGAAFAMKTAGTANSDNEGAKSVVAAGNEVAEKETVAVDLGNAVAETERATVEVPSTTVAQTEAATEAEKETQTEATTEATTEAATEPQTEAPVVTEVAPTEAEVVAPVATPADERVAQVIEGINAERAAVGVAPVTYDPQLNEMAQVRAEEEVAMNPEKLVHQRKDGRAASTICNDFGRYGNFGEVLGRYQSTPAEIVAGWHNSASHYACMTNGVYTSVGVGIAVDADGYIYWSAIFMN